MPPTCILTDSSAIFSTPEFPGSNHVHILAFSIQAGDVLVPDSSNPQDWQWLSKNADPSTLRMIPPTVDDFLQAYWSLERDYKTILVILVSSHLSDAVRNAQEAAEKARGGAFIRIIDSLTTASGLGFLVQAAAEAILRGFDSNHVYTMIRGMIPHIYTILCLQSLTYLAHAGKLHPEQAFIGEMLGFIPFYIIEGGKLIPIQKARGTRQMVDILNEFIAEFNQLQKIAIVQGFPGFEQESVNLKDRLTQFLPEIPIHEHTLGTALMCLFGPRSLGVFALEKVTEL